MPNALLVNAWRFSLRGREGMPWDQIAKYGSFVKADLPVDFNDYTLRQMVTNFGEQKNDLAADYDHQALMVNENGMPAPACAWYDSMLVCKNGELQDWVSHKEDAQPPDVSQWRDGLFARRSEMTDIGRKLIGSYKFISPAFTTEGKDEQGNDIGYQLLNCAWTNVPFLDGMEPLSYSRVGASLAPNTPSNSKGETMPITKMDDADLYKRLGLDDDATPAMVKQAMKTYLRKFDDDDAAMKAKKMDDDDPTMDDSPADPLGGDPTGAKKMADGDADADDKKKPFKKMDDDGGDVQMDDDADPTLKKMAKDLGCVPTMDAIAEAVGVLRFSSVPKAQLAATEKRIGDLEARLAKADSEKIREAAVKFVDAAVADGRWNPKEKQALVDLRCERPSIAEKALQPKGTWTLMTRVTRHGSPIGVVENVSDAEDQDGVDMQEIGAELAVKARKYARVNNVSILEAYNKVGRLDTSYGESLEALRK